jgi:hypothetical protein
MICNEFPFFLFFWGRGGIRGGLISSSRPGGGELCICHGRKAAVCRRNQKSKIWTRTDSVLDSVLGSWPPHLPGGLAGGLSVDLGGSCPPPQSPLSKSACSVYQINTFCFQQSPPQKFQCLLRQPIRVYRHRGLLNAIIRSSHAPLGKRFLHWVSISVLCRKWRRPHRLVITLHISTT